MAEYDVHLFQSEELVDYCREEYGFLDRYKAAEKTAEALELAFDEMSGYDINVDVIRSEVTVPKYRTVSTSSPRDPGWRTVDQDLSEDNVYVGKLGRTYPFSAPHPTSDDSDEFEIYNTGSWWWREYARENENTADHANLLLTADPNATDGGAAFNSTHSSSVYGHVQTGPHCAEWDGHLVYSDDGTDAVQTVVHELGHILLKYDPEEKCDSGDCSGSGQHYMGNISPQRDPDSVVTVLAQTPMSSGAYTDKMYPTNYCGMEPQLKEDEISDMIGLMFSSCAQSYLADPDTNF